MVKPGRFIEEVDPKIIDLGRKHDFPIVEIPPEVRWTHITAEISERIVGEHVALLRRSQDIHQRLLDVVIDGGSWQSIADTTAGTDRPAGRAGGFLSTKCWPSRSPKAKTPELIDGFRGAAQAAGETGRARRPPRATERYQRTPLKEERNIPARVTVPIIVSRDVLGYVSSFETESELNELDLVALESAATVAAVEMGRELTRMEAETRLRGDFVDDLLGDEFDGGPDDAAAGELPRRRPQPRLPLPHRRHRRLRRLRPRQGD